MPLRDKGLCLLKPTPVVGHPACFRLSLSKAAKDVFASEALQCSRCTLEGVGGNGRAGSSRHFQEVWMESPSGPPLGPACPPGDSPTAGERAGGRGHAGSQEGPALLGRGEREAS